MAMADWGSGKRRHYPEAFKRQVVAETAATGVSVASVARRHGLNANLIFNWRRRFASDPGSGFVPAVIIDAAPPATATEACRGPADAEAVLNGRLEVVCLGGRRIVVGPGFDAVALGRLLAVVEGR